MIALLSILALGFVLGMRHATDPDHVIAVTTIVARNKSVRRAAVIGALWGGGHTFMILGIGGGIILAGWVIPARIGLAMESAVGVMLVVLGIMNLTGKLPRSQVEEVCNPETDTWTALPQGWITGNVRPFAVGLVHGLAGSAAIALLVLSTIRNPWAAMAYLAVFGIGTLAGMMLITTAISVPISRAAGWTSASNGFRIASGVLSTAFGVFVCWQIIASGLFTTHPNWSPR